MKGKELFKEKADLTAFHMSSEIKWLVSKAKKGVSKGVWIFEGNLKGHMFQKLKKYFRTHGEISIDGNYRMSFMLKDDNGDDFGLGLSLKTGIYKGDTKITFIVSVDWQFEHQIKWVEKNLLKR